MQHGRPEELDGAIELHRAALAVKESKTRRSEDQRIDARDPKITLFVSRVYLLRAYRWIRFLAPHRFLPIHFRDPRHCYQLPHLLSFLR